MNPFWKNTNELYHKLIHAYSTDNLNKIARKLIVLYKNKNFGQLREIANRISDYIVIPEGKNSKCFSRLMMLYHPDKGEQIQESLKKTLC